MCIFSFKYNELGKQFKENPMLLVTEHSHLLSKILIKSLLNGCTKSTGTWCMMDVHKRSISWSPYYNLNLSKMLFFIKNCIFGDMTLSFLMDDFDTFHFNKAITFLQVLFFLVVFWHFGQTPT